MAIVSLPPPWDPAEDFIIGKDDFAALAIQSSPSDGRFYYFFHKKRRRLVKFFVMDDRPTVSYVCRVSLIKKANRFTPRLAFAVRDKRNRKKVLENTVPSNVAERAIKSSVSLEECYSNFWELIGFLQGLRDVDVPSGKLSLVKQDDASLVALLRDRSANSRTTIIKLLSQTEGVHLSERDVNELLKRRETLNRFKADLDLKKDDEAHWQRFFEQNKWIFGYGLDYQVLRQERSQPYYGGKNVTGSGGEKGDYLASTIGDINFTVLVEIKTPSTPLLSGTKEIRNGAWSLSKELTDAVTQLQANLYRWKVEGSKSDENKDLLESGRVYTVEPKGIIVIGRLSEIENARTKRDTFQRFRRSLHGLDVISFDELYRRARFIVTHEDAVDAG